MKVRPLGNKILVHREESEDKSPGGIIIPDVAKEKPQRGRVIAVGPGKRNDDGAIVPLTLKEGDKVLFTKWGGNEVEVDGEKVLIMTEDDILAVLE